ncbi:hypothetical protein CEXT_747841 [Caerostris extrusa]|uniref:Uncharacterized protein n=1 Tax=Caerostris extrusa TaxID=172846 RepID=A0AAV4T535_CAEEX|nr:hypothetical protein CEXT_747841 [Caerostris extrusa]
MMRAVYRSIEEVYVSTNAQPRLPVLFNIICLFTNTTAAGASFAFTTAVPVPLVARSVRYLEGSCSQQGIPPLLSGAWPVKTPTPHIIM